MANIERMFHLLETPARVVDTDGAHSLQVKGGAIRFERVSFGYHANRKVLQDVSFDIPAGRKIAIVGPSGSGKSTVARLLFRFYDPNEGRILIDEQPIDQVTQQSLRAAIGVVPQDTVLFNESIAFNIGYGKTGASEEEIHRAARMAHLEDFIQQLPEGYDTLVGERGLKLSGGEKQRIAIARTLLKNPAIMVFDEATSSLDSTAEKAILQALREAAENHTSLVIAHRLSTIVDADQILVLKNGQIVERGTHNELVSSDGVYAELWRHQQERKSAVNQLDDVLSDQTFTEIG